MTDVPAAPAAPTAAIPRPRPLSPHLLSYRPQLTSILSILNRATGIALAFGALLLVFWLAALADGPAAFANIQAILVHPVGKLLLLGWVWSLFFHLTNGIRHLVWDTGRGLTLPAVYASGWAVVALSVVLTLLAFGGALALVR